MADTSVIPPKADSEFPKEILVAVPVLGSAIAISYDVGYFYGLDIKLFTLFSIAEHIVFALEALPFALMASAFVAVMIGGAIDEKFKPIAERVAASTEHVPNFLIGLCVLGAIVVTTSLLFYFGLGAAGFLAGLLTGMVLMWLKLISAKKSTATMTIGFLIVVTAFAVGWDASRGYLLHDQAKHLVQTETELLTVKIIRSGDRGLLYFEPKSNQLGFAKWDAIKRISEIW